MANNVTISVMAKDMASRVFSNISSNVSRMAGRIKVASSSTISASKRIGGSFRGIAVGAASMAGGVLSAIGAILKKLALFGGAAAALAGVAFAKIIGAASEMEETMGKFGVVFGEEAGRVGKWSNSMADKLGVSRQEMAGMLSSMQDLLVPMGVNATTAEGMSKQFSQLAVDLGSFNNMPTERVFQDLQAAISGSGEVMKKYGVVLTEANVKQELLNMGMNPKTATDAAKAQARMNIIMRGTTAAQGDAVRTAGSFANQMKRLRSNITNVAASLGGPMLAGLSGVVQTINTKVQGAFAWIEGNSDRIASFAGAIATVLSSIVTRVAAFIQNAVFQVRFHMDIVKGIGQTIGVVFSAAKNIVGEALGAIVGLLGKGVTKLGGFREMMRNAMRGVVTGVTFIEAVLTNLPAVFEMMKNRSALSMLSLGLDIAHIFTKVVPNAFLTLQVVVGNIFKMIVRESVGMFQRMLDTIIGMMQRIASVDPTGVVAAHVAVLQKGSEFLGNMQDSIKTGELPGAVGPRARTSAEDDLQGKIDGAAGTIASSFVDKLGPRLDALNKTFADDDKKRAVTAAQDIFAKVKGFAGGIRDMLGIGKGELPGEQQTTAADAIAQKAAPALQATQARLLSRGGSTDPAMEERKKQSKMLERIARNTEDKASSRQKSTEFVVVGGLT